MRLPFSSTNYSEPAQNLTFLNDISNMRSQINTLASAAAESAAEGSSASGSDATQLGDYTNPHWRDQRVLRIGGIVDNGGNPDTSTQNILEWVEAELPPTPAGAFSGQILRLTYDSSRFTNLRATWQAFPTIQKSNLASSQQLPNSVGEPGFHLVVDTNNEASWQAMAFPENYSGDITFNGTVKLPVGVQFWDSRLDPNTGSVRGHVPYDPFIALPTTSGSDALAAAASATTAGGHATTAGHRSMDAAESATTAGDHALAAAESATTAGADALAAATSSTNASAYAMAAHVSATAAAVAGGISLPFWAMNVGAANKPIVNGMLDSSYFLGTGQQGGNASSGVTMSNGVVTITTAGYYSLTFTIELYQATATLIHVDQHIKYEAGGGTPSSATPHIASAMNIWTDIRYSQSTQEAVTSYANTLQVLRYLQAGSRLQCFLQTFSGSPSAYLIGNRSTHFSGFRVG